MVHRLLVRIQGKSSAHGNPFLTIEYDEMMPNPMKRRLTNLAMLIAVATSGTATAQDRGDRLVISPPPREKQEIKQPAELTLFDIKPLHDISGSESLFPKGHASLGINDQLDMLADDVQAHGGFAARHSQWFAVAGDPASRARVAEQLKRISDLAHQAALVRFTVCRVDRDDPIAQESSKGFLQPAEVGRLKAQIADGTADVIASPSIVIQPDSIGKVSIENEEAGLDFSVKAQVRFTPRSRPVLGISLEGMEPTPELDEQQARRHSIQHRIMPLSKTMNTQGFIARVHAITDKDDQLGTRVLDPEEMIVVLTEAETFKLEGQPPAMVPVDIYQDQEATRDGIGKRYFGREIAQVMGHLAAGWLERPQREQEEKTSKLMNMLPYPPEGDIDHIPVAADIGAGSGYFTRRLARQAPEGIVMATDIQPEMLQFLKQGLEIEGIDNVKTVLGRIDDTGLEAETVDMILLVDVYHEFDHPWEMARSMFKALRPGGVVALVEYRANDPEVPIKPLHTMTEEQAILEFEIAGFEWIWTRGDLPWQRLIVFQRPE